LVDIWSDILNVDAKAISINKSFFELGGHSLNVVNLISRIEKEFNTKVSIQGFFMKPTVKELNRIILAGLLSRVDVTTHDVKKITV
jgi:acyl carrier protein